MRNPRRASGLLIRDSPFLLAKAGTGTCWTGVGGGCSGEDVMSHSGVRDSRRETGVIYGNAGVETAARKATLGAPRRSLSHPVALTLLNIFIHVVSPLARSQVAVRFHRRRIRSRTQVLCDHRDLT